MKKVFLLALALCAVQANATDMAMNCGQQGFQVALGFGYGLTTPTNSVYEFSSPLNTPGDITQNLETIVEPNQFVEEGLLENPLTMDFTALALDYSNISPWQSMSSILGSFSLGYKTFFDCNKYSVTGNAFIMLNGTSMTSNLMAETTNFQVEVDNAAETTDPLTATASLIGAIGSSMQYAGKLKLSSGTVFGFNVLLAKEFSWGNAGLLLGMKFNSYKLSYLQTNPQIVTDGANTEAGYMEISGDLNNNISLDIGDYTYSKSKTLTATGFTVGFATNYYISDNVSAGLTLFYDMYAPISFNLEDINIAPYIESTQEQVTDSGKVKFQNNTIGVMMNLTYSFGAN